MKVDQLYQVIINAHAHGADPLERYVRRATGAQGAELAELTHQATRVIDEVPALLAQVAEAAEIRGVGLLVQPLLDHAAAYFLDPVDHAPELAFGVPGLLDDAYLALRVVELIKQAYGPLVAADLDARLTLLSRLLGADLIRLLDAELGHAVLRLVVHVAALRQWAVKQ